MRNLAVLRERRGLSQAEVARRVGTTQSAIARLERADVDPRLSTVVKYLTVLGAALAVEDARSARLVSVD